MNDANMYNFIACEIKVLVVPSIWSEIGLRLIVKFISVNHYTGFISIYNFNN